MSQNLHKSVAPNARHYAARLLACAREIRPRPDRLARCFLLWQRVPRHLRPLTARHLRIAQMHHQFDMTRKSRLGTPAACRPSPAPLPVQGAFIRRPLNAAQQASSRARLASLKAGLEGANVE